MKNVEGDLGIWIASVKEQVLQLQRSGVTYFPRSAPNTANARLVFVGEQPIVGEAGKLLSKMIEAMGLKGDEVYIYNVAKFKPQEARNPQYDLKHQLAVIKPEVIVTLGSYACQCILGSDMPISELRGKWGSFEGISVMPTFHPELLLQDPAKKREVWEDLQEVMQRLGMSSPVEQ